MSEDQLIERYRGRILDRQPTATETDLNSRVIDTPWGVGYRFHRGFYAIAFARRSVWPETQIVIETFWQAHPDRRFVVMRAVWPPDRIHDAGPPDNVLFYANLWESIMTRAPKWLAVQPGPVVYFIWTNSVDFANPPAPGEPPSELLSARAEVRRIKSHWRDES